MSHSPIAAEGSVKSSDMVSAIPRGTLIILGALLVGETTINYIDRQIVSIAMIVGLSLMGRVKPIEYHASDSI